MKHLGDITKIDGGTAPVVEVVIGGSPCQDLSVAGRREGLSGARSGLFMEQIKSTQRGWDTEYTKMIKDALIRQSASD